ncbi:MAG: tetratricopeptide repeat protein [Calditrichae bacterium]|nr:tetratricopeptide repeat protein [Calditrichia bacterium]
MNNYHKLFSILLLFILSIPVFAQFQDDSNEFSYALKLYNQKFYDLAAQQFIKYYNTYPNSQNVDEAKFYAGMSLFTIEQYKNARIEFQSLALEFPKSTRAAESWFKTGECYEKLESFAEAAKSFETLKTLYPNDVFAANALYRAGINYARSGDMQKAKSVLNAILDAYPESSVYFKAMIELARVYNSLENTEQSKLYLEKVIQNSKDESELAQAIYTNALINFNQGYSNAAEKLFLKVTEKYPRTEYNALASFYLGKISLINGSYSRSLEFLNKAESADLPEKLSTDLIILKGDANFLNKKFALAEKEYLKIKTAENDSLRLILTLKKAICQKQQGLQKQANALLDGIFKPENRTSSLEFKILTIYLDWLQKSGDYKSSLSLIQQRLKKTTSESERYTLAFYLNMIYQQMSSWRDIVREIKPFINTAGTTEYADDFIYGVARAYKNLGEYQESAYYFELIMTQYSASKYYNQAEAAYQELKDYYLVDQTVALRRLAAIIGSLSHDKSKTEIPLLLGKVYFSDLKDYDAARVQFEEAITVDQAHKGDGYLYLGKTLVKLANKKNKGQAEMMQLFRKASENFQAAVENIKTCSTPDEASWLMVQTGISVDTLSVQKQKKYIETLLEKYKNSTFREDWLSALAHDLAFEPGLEDVSKNYFQELIKNHKSSKDYPSYLYGYAKLIREQEPENAIDLFKSIALDYPNAPEAVHALHEVAQYYEDKQMYKEAAQLNTMLLDRYYYADPAKNVDSKLGELYLKAGQYNDALRVLQDKVNDPFLNDIVLSIQFDSESLKNNLVYMGMAYKRLNETNKAREYFIHFLTLAADNPLKSTVSFELAELYFQENKMILALEYFKNVSKEDNEHYSRALLYKGDILFKNQEYAEAGNAYEELSAISKDSEQLKDIRGKFIICRIKTGAISQSETYIKEYKKQFPDADEYFAKFTLELGEYQRMNKNFDKAIRYYKSVKSSYSKTSSVDDAEYYIALVYVTLNKNEDAFDILTGFYNKYPDSDKLPSVLNTLGSLYFRSEKYDNAISTFKNALKKSNDRFLSQQIMGNLIKTYSLTGFWDAAQGLARQYVEDYPDAEDRLDKKLVIAQAFINLNQFQNAVEYLKRMKLEADSEKEPEIQFYIGEAYLKAGQYEDAIAEFVKIPLLSKKTKLQWEASALYYSGQAYEKLGRISDAIRMYKEIIERPGIDLILKRDAEKRISQIQG